MGYVVPPRVETASRFRRFLRDSSVPNSLVAQGLAQFDNLPPPVSDLTSWTASGANSFRASLGAVGATPPASTTDPYSQIYLSGQALGRLVDVSFTTPTLIFKVGGKSKAFSLPSFSSATPHNSATVAYEQELQAQNTDPELFLLWVCRLHLDETAFPSRLEKLCDLIDVAAIALPETLYKAKRLVGAKRPYQVKPVTEFLPRPGHSSWPGGHAFAMGAISTLVLEALQDKLDAPIFSALKNEVSIAARRIANNREGAGLHWANDAKVGLEAGEFVVNELLAQAISSGDTDIKYLVTLFRSIP